MYFGFGVTTQWRNKVCVSQNVNNIKRLKLYYYFYRYILIPPTIAREPAAASILKKGKKLHLCQNHTFVAVKSSWFVNKF